MSEDKTGAEQDRHFRIDHLRTDLKGRALRGGAVTLAAQAAKFIVQLTNTFVLARLLAPNDFGLVGMVTSLTGFLLLFKDLGLTAATVQRTEINQAQVSTLFWINSAFGLVLALLTVAAAPAVAALYQEPRLASVTVALGFGFLFYGLVVQHQALLRRQMRFVQLMIVELFAQVCGAVCGIWMALSGVGYWSLVWAQVVIAVVTLPASWIACRWRPGMWTRNCDVRSMLSFGGNLAALRMISYWVANLDNVLIGRVWGARQLGLYSRAYGLLMLPFVQINLPVHAVALPALSRLLDAPERYREAYKRMLQAVVLMTMPVVVVTIGAADWVVAVMLGPQWTEAAHIFAWLGIMALSEPVTNSIGTLFISQGRTREMLRSEMITGTIGIAAIVSGLPWGAKGVAACFALASLLLRAPITYWFAGRSGPVRTRDVYTTVAPFGFSALIALGALLGFRRLNLVEQPLAGLVASGFVVALVMLGALLAQPAGRRALSELRNLLPALRKKPDGNPSQK